MQMGHPFSRWNRWHASRTRSETTADERGKAAYLEIHANLQQGKTYFSITTKEGVQQYLDFRKRAIRIP